VHFVERANLDLLYFCQQQIPLVGGRRSAVDQRIDSGIVQPGRPAMSVPPLRTKALENLKRADMLRPYIDRITIVVSSAKPESFKLFFVARPRIERSADRG